MKILISAYACEPNKGSEPEAGGQHMIKSANKYEKVVVVTRANNKHNIEKTVKELDLDNVFFEYFDLPYVLQYIKRLIGSIAWYVYIWKYFFFFFVKKNKKNSFDLVQRVTFVSYKYLFIWYFGKKFILGPIGGGERYPLDFLKIFSFKGKLKEIIRFIFQHISLFDPLVLITLFKSDEIIAVTDDSKSILPNFVQKTIIKPAISIDVEDFEKYKKPSQNNKKLKILYVGNLLELKGIKLILMSLKKVKNKKYEFNIVGSGPDENIFRKYVVKHNLNVNFLGKIKRKFLSKYYLENDLLVFPSLHDSGGMVILEAKAHALPVVVSSFGGPKMFVNVNQGDIIINSKKVHLFVEELYKILNEI